MSMESPQRHIGLWGATGLGVGAIVGGGILALAGVALATTGPSAILAFALNGGIALLTALSFSELAAAYPQSGGTYVYAKKVLSVEAAFCVGWVVWFASIVAAVLYALGFGVFTIALIEALSPAAFTMVTGWLSEEGLTRIFAVCAVVVYLIHLVLKSDSAGQWANFGKLVVFGVLIAAGFWSLTGRSAVQIESSMVPFFTNGLFGLFQAMGFTFIALQGFDLIAAAGGEIRQPERTIPKAMFLSLGIALLVYLPFLFLIMTVGTEPGSSIQEVSAKEPETIVIVAAENYLGAFGFWLVMAAAILSMLSALRANLFAASRIAAAMAHDRTLPRLLAWTNPQTAIPQVALCATATIVTATILVVPDLAGAGAAASLVFLLTFALVHVIVALARRRAADRLLPFRIRWFPMVTTTGLLACVSLAVFQGIAVPIAGLIAGTWLVLGGILFVGLFRRRARIVDAANTALDPKLVQLRGNCPLVLVPIANPDNARSLVGVANALAPPDAGRVLLLTVVIPPENWDPESDPQPFKHAQEVLGEALSGSATNNTFPETLTTIAADPWTEIRRVAKDHRCESLLLGLSKISDQNTDVPVEELIGRVDSNVVVLRAERHWQITSARRVLVPVGGRGGHDRLLARLLGVLSRIGTQEVTFLKVVPEGMERKELQQAEREIKKAARDQFEGHAKTKVVQGNPADAIAQHAAESDLVIMGMRRVNHRKKIFGRVSLDIASKTSCPMIVISRR
ncbi:MAG: amino acid permease [Planctomycetales bacterium]